uniref:1-alkyl-2-acetylglycerophosphocholine esterase n=1 Tax=Pyrodinium bahamense TaxID=73915 RepID=A0A7S0FHT7_9DINO|mmetsp:Transcript_32110/g.88532  ORF Transcript_32110/g.88532 Transcript_32110/m.88532 type:complete len:387 (+) Transcript_32110:67-1227(+)
MVCGKLTFVLALLPHTRGDNLWPPSSLHTFSSDWDVLSDDFAAHSAWGGKTVAKSASDPEDMLLVFLPGTFTVPAQFSILLEWASSLGFDIIGLDYGWGPAPDSKVSAQCASTDSCQECMDNYHEVVLTGNGSNLENGNWPVFGEEQASTLAPTYWLSYGVQFIPTTQVPEVNSSAPLPEPAQEYILSMHKFSITTLLIRVLQKLGWSKYLTTGAQVKWDKVFLAGHSQGAGHAGYTAFRHPEILGALMLSGPQDTCGEKGAARLPAEHSHLYRCYAEDEPGRPAIEKTSSSLFNLTATIHSENSQKYRGQGIWCPPPAHCATAVDDQLVAEAVDVCFGMMRKVIPSGATTRPSTTPEPVTVAGGAAVFSLIIAKVVGAIQAVRLQ